LSSYCIETKCVEELHVEAELEEMDVNTMYLPIYRWGNIIYIRGKKMSFSRTPASVLWM